MVPNCQYIMLLVKSINGRWAFAKFGAKANVLLISLVAACVLVVSLGWTNGPA